MIKPTLEEAKKLACGHTIIPISMEIYSDIRTPMEILKVLKSQGENAFILESVENGESWGRYTFLGYNPSKTVTGTQGAVVVKTPEEEKLSVGNTHELLKKIVNSYKSPNIIDLPTFTGGFVGYFSFDYTQSGEFCLMLYKQVFAFDHLKQKIFLIVNIETENLEQNYIEGVATLKDMETLVINGRASGHVNGKIRSAFTQSFTEVEFIKAVEKIQHYINKGEVRQVVPSIKFTAAYDNDLLQAYRNLRTINPSSYMFYIEFDKVRITGASPETLVSLKNGTVSTFPLAGTCKRTENEDENNRSITKLLADPKELAEHEMLVDLGKEDLRKICEPDSVKVDDYRSIKTCSHVYHIQSKVHGKIKPEFDAFDALRVSLPAGTLSGAPRERAIEIIKEIEGTKRDVYGGAVGYIDFNGNMDMCIGIRMAVLKDGKVSVQAGAGIVAESVPVNEYNECCNKSRAMLLALELGGN